MKKGHAANKNVDGKDQRLRIAITHVRLGWGGSEKRVLWGIHALKDKYDVTLITAGDYDLDALNVYYGTSLQPGDFKTLQVPLLPFMRSNAKAAVLRGALYQRFCRRIAKDYDVLISGYGPTDFGRPAVHFIADFSWDSEIRESLHPYPPGLIYKKSLLRSLYLSISEMFNKPSGRDLFSGEDLMVSVSPWVSQVMKERHGVNSPVLYSPVPGSFPEYAWKEKLHGFVCMGRISPEKRIERIISILEKVRDKGHDLHLHVIGGISHQGYWRKVKVLCDTRKNWVSIEGRLSGKNKAEILAKHRYGIHACEGDAFPGVLVEMMRAGCVTWAHRSGGQVDMLGDKRLLYLNEDEAVEKICRVLSDESQQKDLYRQLKNRAEKYSVEQFSKQIRRLVEEWGDG